MNFNKRKRYRNFHSESRLYQEITIKRHSIEMEMLVGTFSEEIYSNFLLFKNAIPRKEFSD